MSDNRVRSLGTSASSACARPAVGSPPLGSQAKNTPGPVRHYRVRPAATITVPRPPSVSLSWRPRSQRSIPPLRPSGPRGACRSRSRSRHPAATTSTPGLRNSTAPRRDRAAVEAVARPPSRRPPLPPACPRRPRPRAAEASRGAAEQAPNRRRRLAQERHRQRPCHPAAPRACREDPSRVEAKRLKHERRAKASARTCATRRLPRSDPGFSRRPRPSQSASCEFIIRSRGRRFCPLYQDGGTITGSLGVLAASKR